MRSLAAAVLACALTDLLKGRDSAEILSWIEGRPAALPFWMACQWLDISPQATRERLQALAANPDAYQGTGWWSVPENGPGGSPVWDDPVPTA